MRTLQRLGLATPLGPTQWQLADDAELRLRALGERNNIIKRMHRELAKKGWERGAEFFALSGETEPHPIVGRLVARGFDDELKGTTFDCHPIETIDPPICTLSSPLVIPRLNQPFHRRLSALS